MIIRKLSMFFEVYKLYILVVF